MKTMTKYKITKNYEYENTTITENTTCEMADERTYFVYMKK